MHYKAANQVKHLFFYFYRIVKLFQLIVSRKLQPVAVLIY